MKSSKTSINSRKFDKLIRDPLQILLLIICKYKWINFYSLGNHQKTSGGIETNSFCLTSINIGSKFSRQPLRKKT